MFRTNSSQSHSRRPVQRPALIESLEARRFLTAVLPGGDAYVLLYGTTLAARPELAGTIIYDHTTPFSGGSLHQQVVRENGSGTLDFYQSIFVDSYIPPNITVHESVFTRFSTDVDYRSDSPGVNAPYLATRSKKGDSVNISFGQTFALGQPTHSFFIKTDATQFDLNGSTTITYPAGGGRRYTSPTIVTVAAFSGTAEPSRDNGPTRTLASAFTIVAVTQETSGSAVFSTSVIDLESNRDLLSSPGEAGQGHGHHVPPHRI